MNIRSFYPGRLLTGKTMARSAEVLLVIGICTLATYWALALLAGPPLPAPPRAASVAESTPQSGSGIAESARLFGSRPPGTLSENVQALGIIADRNGRGSVLISIDGQPPRHYRVGDRIDGRRVTAIRAREIELESSGSRTVVRLNAPAVASEGIVRR